MTLRSRRSFTGEFKREAVTMLLDAYSAPSVAERLGLPNPSLFYRWKNTQLEQSGRLRQQSYVPC
ncbi:MAG: transposase [Planctomycetota bacterium]